MISLTDIAKRLPARPAAVTALLALLPLSLIGCAGMNRQYTPQTLPAQLRAQPVRGAQGIDVSKIAAAPARSDLVEAGDMLKVAMAAGLSPDAIAEFYVWVDDDGTATRAFIHGIIMEEQGLHLPDYGRPAPLRPDRTSPDTLQGPHGFEEGESNDAS